MREAIAQHLRVHEQAVVSEDVGEPAPVGIEGRTIGFEMHVATHEERPQTVAGLRRERRWGIEATPDFRRIDSEQPHPARVPQFDRVAVQDVPHREMIRGARTDGRDRENGRQEEPDAASATHTVAAANSGPGEATVGLRRRPVTTARKPARQLSAGSCESRFWRSGVNDIEQILRGRVSSPESTAGALSPERNAAGVEAAPVLSYSCRCPWR